MRTWFLNIACVVLSMSYVGFCSSEHIEAVKSLRRYEGFQDNPAFKPLVNHDKHSVADWLRVDQIAYKMAVQLFSLTATDIDIDKIEALAFGKKIVPSCSENVDVDIAEDAMSEDEVADPADMDEDLVNFEDEHAVDDDKVVVPKDADGTLAKFLDLQSVVSLEKSVESVEESAESVDHSAAKAGQGTEDKEKAPKSDVSKSEFQMLLQNRLETLPNSHDKKKVYLWICSLHEFHCECRREAGDVKPVPFPLLHRATTFFLLYLFCYHLYTYLL